MEPAVVSPTLLLSLLITALISSVFGNATDGPYVLDVASCDECTAASCLSAGAADVPGICYPLGEGEARCACRAAALDAACDELDNAFKCSVYEAFCEWSFAAGKCYNASDPTAVPSEACFALRKRKRCLRAKGCAWANKTCYAAA